MTTSPSIADALRDRVLSFTRPDDWDGLGGRRITHDACRRALDFLREAEAAIPQLDAPRASPSALGGVSLYWRFGDRHLTVRVLSDEREALEYATKVTGSRPTARLGSVADALEVLRGLLTAG
jgi:hypothetical protein